MAFHMPLKRWRISENVETNSTRKHASTEMALSMPAELLRVHEGFSTHLNRMLVSNSIRVIKKLIEVLVMSHR